MIKRIVFAALLSLVATAAASAADPMDSYRQYRAALESGDNAAALAHAKDAYDGAEATWGASNAKTALLATNYGVELLAAGRAAEAAPVLERCAEILAALPDKATDRAFCLLKAGDAYNRDGEKSAPKAKKAFESAIDVAEPLAETDLRAAGIAGEAYLARATLAIPTVAQMRYSWEKNTKDSIVKRTGDNVFNPYAPVKRYAEKALPLLEKAYGTESDLVAMAVLYLGFYAEADEDWYQAEKLYARSYEILRARLGDNHRLTLQVYGRKSIAAAKTVKGLREYKSSEGDWEDKCITAERGERVFTLCPDGKRKQLRYPTSGSYAGQQGFTLVRYDVSEAGVTSNIRVIESWPGEVFDKVVTRAIEAWRFKPPTDQNGVVGAVSDIELSITFFIIGN